MKKVKIYIVRHGETLFNTQHIAQGWCDSKLTEKGLAQAKYTGYGLKNVDFNKAYSGDLSRQIDTAKVILQENEHSKELTINVDERFRETNFGEYDGKPITNMMKPLFAYAGVAEGDYDNLWSKITDYEFSKCVEDSSDTVEKMDQVAVRMYEGLNDICAKANDGDTILLVSSGCSINDLLEYMFPDGKRTLPDNCAVSLIDFASGKYQLEKFNDLSYRDSGEKYFNK